VIELTIGEPDGPSPVQIRRIEDVGRHKIVRARLGDHDLNIIAPENAVIGQDMTRVTFDPAGINVYVNDWRVAPGGRQSDSVGKAA
jgi:glycerol transport system ATP-binding protein